MEYTANKTLSGVYWTSSSILHLGRLAGLSGLITFLLDRTLCVRLPVSKPMTLHDPSRMRSMQSSMQVGDLRTPFTVSQCGSIVWLSQHTRGTCVPEFLSHPQCNFLGNYSPRRGRRFYYLALQCDTLIGGWEPIRNLPSARTANVHI